MNRHQVGDLRPFGVDLLQPFETYLLDLERSEDELWKNLKSECRNRIRKAQKNCYEVRLESGPAFLDDFWTMSVAVFAKTSRNPTFTRQFLDEVWRRLSAAGQVLAISAYRGNQRESIPAIYPDDAKRLLRATARSHRGYRANGDSPTTGNTPPGRP